MRFVFSLSCFEHRALAARCTQGGGRCAVPVCAHMGLGTSRARVERAAAGGPPGDVRTEVQDMAGYGGIWRDMAGYGGIWWDVVGCGGMSFRYGQIL